MVQVLFESVMAEFLSPKVITRPHIKATSNLIRMWTIYDNEMNNKTAHKHLIQTQLPFVPEHCQLQIRAYAKLKAKFLI